MSTGPRSQDPPQLEGTQADDILAIQVEQVYRQSPLFLLVNVFNGLILVVILWGNIEPKRLTLWFTTLCLITTLRALLVIAYRNPHRRAEWNSRIWGHGFVLGAFLAGVVWGAAGISLFHPTSFPHQVFVAFALGGMAAGAIPILSFLPPAYASFAVPISLPITVEMFAQGDSIHFTMGIMILIFLSAMLTSSTQFHRVFRESIDLRVRLSSSLEERQELAQLARIDALTGIPNRRSFDEAIGKEWRRAQRRSESLALIMADIDYFKRFNDRLGHQAGDNCLRQVAGAISRAVRRPGDLAARIGGEEFAFLLPRASIEDASVIAEQIRADVESLRIRHPGSEASEWVTISLGVAAISPASGESVQGLMRAADTALYRAKHGGRNGVRIND